MKKELALKKLRAVAAVKRNTKEVELEGYVSLLENGSIINTYVLEGTMTVSNIWIDTGRLGIGKYLILYPNTITKAIKYAVAGYAKKRIKKDVQT